MEKPKIIKAYENLPLSYDPKREKYLYYKELISGEEQIVPLEKLSMDEAKKLVIKRIEDGPDIPSVEMTGEIYTKERTIESILNEEDHGNRRVEGEISMLRDLLNNIESYVRSKKRQA